MLTKIAQYAKAALAFAGAVAVFLTAHGFPAEGKWLTGVVAAVTAAVVMIVPNAKRPEKPARY